MPVLLCLAAADEVTYLRRLQMRLAGTRHRIYEIEYLVRPVTSPTLIDSGRLRLMRRSLPSFRRPTSSPLRKQVPESRQTLDPRLRRGDDPG